QEGIRKKFGIPVEYLPMPNDSTENNGALVAKYLKAHAGDGGKYIVLGYSKGAPDVQYALATDSTAAESVRAFITVAGAVGGSPVAGVMPEQAKRYMEALHLGQCEGDLAATFQSLRRDIRQSFLSTHPDPVVPTYSLAAVSNDKDTSKVMLQNWRLLAVY